VRAASFARLSLASQAACSLGVASVPTVVETRPLGITANLFLQESGWSECTFAAQPDTVFPFFCGSGGTCPALFQTQGSHVVTSVEAPQPAHAGIREAAWRAAGIDAYSQAVVITVCAGAYNVTVTQPDGTGQSTVAGNASSGDVVRITIIENYTQTSSGGSDGSSSSQSGATGSQGSTSVQTTVGGLASGGDQESSQSSTSQSSTTSQSTTTSTQGGTSAQSSTSSQSSEDSSISINVASHTASAACRSSVFQLALPT